MTFRRRGIAAMAGVVLAACDRFGAAQAQPGGFGADAPMTQQMATQGGQYPPGGAYPQVPTPQGPAGGAMNLTQLEAWERQDAGVRPTNQLHAGPPHGPTPNAIPGGQVITTKGLLPLIQGTAGVPVIVLDVLGNPQMQLPNAVPAVYAAQAGDFNDGVQQQFGQMLMQLTQGNKQIPIVTYCQGPQCWMSYNAALRAIALGYRNVLWYRGGLEAFQQGMASMAGVGGQPPAMNGAPLDGQPGTAGGNSRE